MADILSILSVAGLIYAGRSLSKQEPVEVTPPPVATVPSAASALTPPPVETPYADERVPYLSKQEMPSFSVIAPQMRSSGQEVLDMRDRFFDSGRMNNLSPVEKQLVGPGLGVGPEVAATGGFQQNDFRVNPINVGEYKLTTLPGRTNHGHDITGGRQTQMGEFGRNRPETTTFLPDRLPAQRGRVQGMSAATPRQEHERTKRTTNRSETGLRNDGLDKNPAKRLVSGMTLSQDPTRFKTDLNEEQYFYMNRPQPGISSFHGGYLNTAALKVNQKNNEELMKYGFRPEDKRGKKDRFGNAGRMNVRESAVKQGGKVTAVRVDRSRVDGRVNPANGAWGAQNYYDGGMHDTNAFKGNANPYASCASLGVAKRQLANNPYANTF